MLMEITAKRPIFVTMINSMGIFQVHLSDGLLADCPAMSFVFVCSKCKEVELGHQLTVFVTDLTLLTSVAPICDDNNIN